MPWILLLLAALFTPPLSAAALPGVPTANADKTSASEPDVEQKRAAYAALADVLANDSARQELIDHDLGRIDVETGITAIQIVTAQGFKVARKFLLPLHHRFLPTYRPLRHRLRHVRLTSAFAHQVMVCTLTMG